MALHDLLIGSDASTNSAEVVTSNHAPSPSPTIAIRQFCSDDLPAVCEIFVDGFPPSTDAEFAALLQAYVESCLEDDLGDIHGTYITKGGNFWVATAQSSALEQPQVIGMVGLEKKSESSEGELRRMSVKREFRRYGVGKLLVAELEAWAKTNGFTGVNLWTGKLLTSAHAFYTSVGYEKRSERAIPEDPKFIVIEFAKAL